MVHELENISTPQELFEKHDATINEGRLLISAADACFEMFSLRELKNPSLILAELKEAFPELSEGDILKAVAMAISWKRLLRAAGKPLH